MADTHDWKRRQWLRAIAHHPDTDESDAAVADGIFGESLLADQPSESVGRLIRAGFLNREDDGRFAAVFPTRFSWQDGSPAGEVGPTQATQAGRRVG